MTLRIDLCALTALVRAPLFEALRLPGVLKNYRKLPDPVRKLADKNFDLLKSDPRHPSLRFKKTGRFFLARVGLSYRVLGVEVEGGVLWFWIGSHADYDKFLGRSP